MFEELYTLEDEMRLCRTHAQQDASSPCHELIEWSCYSDFEAGLVWPKPRDLNGPVEIAFVGINPRWTRRDGPVSGEINRGRNAGWTFSHYQRHILESAHQLMPPNGTVAFLDLVPCGTPSGTDVLGVLKTCRHRFFDRTIGVIRPKIIVAIGRFASDHLYWYNTHSGRSGVSWSGITSRHATVEDAEISGHRCKIVFVLQPSARVSIGKRNAARDAVAAAYAAALSESS